MAGNEKVRAIKSNFSITQFVIMKTIPAGLSRQLPDPAFCIRQHYTHRFPEGYPYR